MEANEVKETQETTVEEVVVEKPSKFAKLKAWWDCKWNRNKTHVRDIAIGAAAIGGIVAVAMLSRKSDSDYETETEADYELEYSSDEPLEIESDPDSDTEEATK